MIDEPTTTVTIRRPTRDRTEDHFDPDQTAEPKTVAKGLRANISVPTNRFVQGTKTVTSYRFFTDPIEGDTVIIGDRLFDERTQDEYTISSALLRLDADYADDPLHPDSLSHIVGDLVMSKGARR